MAEGLRTGKPEWRSKAIAMELGAYDAWRLNDVVLADIAVRGGRRTVDAPGARSRQLSGPFTAEQDR